MVCTILLLLFVYAFSFIKETLATDTGSVNNSYKLNAPKPNIFCPAPPKLNFTKTYKQILSVVQYIKKLNIFKRIYQLNGIIIISVIVHIVALFILSMIKVKEKPIEMNWQVQLVPSEEEIQEVEVANMAPPLEEEGDSSEQGGNENKTDDYAQNIPIPEISDTIIINANINAPSPIKFSNKTHLAKVNFNRFVKGNSAGKGNGYGFGNGNGFGGNGNGNGDGKTLFGQKIIAKKLGVILDISPSMAIYIPELKSEIEANFKDAKFQEVNGCGIRQSSPTTYAIEDLANKGVDAIYWFCDLQDNRTKDGMEKIKNILKAKGIRLYVKSLDFPPDEELQATIRSSGGMFLSGQLKTFSKF